MAEINAILQSNNPSIKNKYIKKIPVSVGHNTHFWEVTITMKWESLFLFTACKKSMGNKLATGKAPGGSQSVDICEVREKERKCQCKFLLAHHFNMC